MKEQSNRTSSLEYIFGTNKNKEVRGFKCQKYLEEKLAHFTPTERIVIEPVLTR
jgi:hypothetical protein